MEKNKKENSIKPECTIVVYHSIGSLFKKKYLNAKGLSEENFSGQLDFLSKNYNIISLKDYSDFLHGRLEIPQNSCVLTFDDGFKNNYLNAFPILKQKKIPACFFPSTLPMTKSIILPVHQTKLLLAEVGIKILTDEFNQILKNEFPNLLSEFFVEGANKKDKRYKWDDNLTANFKYSVSGLPRDFKNKIIGKIFDKYFKDVEGLCQDLYINFDEMKEMIAGGMDFGSHSYSHSKLSELSEAKQIEEIKDSKNILEKGLGIKVKLFSYPFGSYNDKTINILKSQGYECSVTTDYGVNYGKDVDVFALKRLDTLEFPFKEN